MILAWASPFNHDILIDKGFMESRPRNFTFFKSYLNNRTQYVDYDGTTSDTKQITTGVLQGSILGLLLFIIYINDISNSSNFLKLFFMQMIVLQLLHWKCPMSI